MHFLSIAAVSGGLILCARAQDNKFPQTPLSEKRFEYNNLPYKVDTDNLERGTQQGYNQCNSTTENQNSLCQTSIINAVDDFCVWSAPEPNSMVGDTEGEAVAWCTKPGHGTRLIPQGALRGVQFTRTPDYVQVVGFIDQSLINLAGDDFGGEMDPHGADLRGNPLGGLLFSNAWGGNYKQVVEWHNFVGSNYFCLKACDPAGSNAAKFCEHIYDRIGCAFNAPSNATIESFTSCDGDNQLFPGVYVENGATMTYTQPPESLGPITTMPYTAQVPASSNCQTYSSAQLFTALPSPSKAPAISGSTVAISSQATGSGAGASGSRTGAGAASTSAPNSAVSRTDGSVVSTLCIIVLGLVFSMML